MDCPFEWTRNGREKVEKSNYFDTILEPYKDESHRVFFFSDAYDALFNGGVDQILNIFEATGAKIFISAEENCYPDSTLFSR